MYFYQKKRTLLIVFLFFTILSALIYFLLIKEKKENYYQKEVYEKEITKEEIPLLEFLDLIEAIQDNSFISGTVKEINLKEDKNSKEETIVEITLLINLEAYFKNPPVSFVEKKFLKRVGHSFKDSESFFVADSIDQDSVYNKESVIEMDLRKLKEGEYVEVVIDGDIREIMRREYYFPPLIRWVNYRNSEDEDGLMKLVPHVEEKKENCNKQLLCGSVENFVREDDLLKEISLSIAMPYWFVNSPIPSLLRNFSVEQNTDFQQGNPREIFPVERFLNEHHIAEFWQEDLSEWEYLYDSFDSFDPNALQNGDLLCIHIKEDIREIMQRETYTLVKVLKIIR